MSSEALSGLREGVQEIAALESVNPTPTGAAPVAASSTRVVGRASVVLLCSHFERYFYRVNEETAEWLYRVGITGDQLPEALRLLHSKTAIDDLAGMDWLKRATKLANLAADEMWLWQPGVKGRPVHRRWLSWMKSPSPDDLVRYYGYWGISNIFEAITRTKTTKADLWLRLRTMVEKRNNIAHGDMSEQATPRDVRGFTKSVLTFCERADRKLSARVRVLFRTGAPW